jgi:hypothetical protein
MATVALLQEALVNSLVHNGALGLDADDGDEASVDDEDDGSDAESLDTTLVRRGAELSGIARSAYSPLKELEEELPNMEEEELPNSLALPVGETRTMTQRLHEQILSSGPPLATMEEVARAVALAEAERAAARAAAEAAKADAEKAEAAATQYGAAQYGSAQHDAAQYGATQLTAAAERHTHANEEARQVAEGAVMGAAANEEARQVAGGAVMGAVMGAAAKAAKTEAEAAEAARVEALETARVALARSEQLEAEVPMPASNGL